MTFYYNWHMREISQLNCITWPWVMHDLYISEILLYNRVGDTLVFI